MNYRLLTSALLVASIIFLPYWIYVPALIIAMAAFPFFWEAILFGFLIDVLYGSKIVSLYSGAILTLIGLLMLMPLRKRLRSHV